MQPEVNQTRQSGPEAKWAKADGGLHDLPPGGPVMPGAMGYENPGATPNLRGVEANTAMSNGTENPMQMGSPGMLGDPPDSDQSGMTYSRGGGNVQAASEELALSGAGEPFAPPEPDPMGVRK